MLKWLMKMRSSARFWRNCVRLADGTVAHVPTQTPDSAARTQASFGVRPEDLRVATDADGSVLFEGRIDYIEQLGEVQRRLGRAAEMQLRLAEHLVPLADDDFRLLCSARTWPRRLRQAAKEARALCVVSALLASLEAHDSGSEQVDEAAAAVRRLRAVCEAKAREVKAAALSRSPSSALATMSVGYRTSVPAW